MDCHDCSVGSWCRRIPRRPLRVGVRGVALHRQGLVMRFLRAILTGWFFMDGLKLAQGKDLLLYPNWVPIVGLLILCGLYEWMVIKHESNKL